MTLEREGAGRSSCGRLYKRGSSPQRSVRLLAAGGLQALAQCENLTSWANEILKQKDFPPITDLRKSIADGTTLADLVECLAGEKLGGAAGKPLSRSQKVENLQQCVDFLDRQGIDITGLDPQELADGNLKSTLMLVNNIRKRYDNQYVQREMADGALQPPQVHSRPGSAHARFPPDPGEAPPTPGPKPPLPARLYTVNGQGRSVPRPHSVHNGGSMDILPGVLTHADDQLHTQTLPPPNLVSTTELDQHSASQRGVDERRPYLAQAGHGQPAMGHSVRGGKPALHDPSHSPLHLPPTSTSQAWASPAKLKSNSLPPGGVREAVSQTVEERLKNLLDTPQSGSAKPAKGVINGGFDYEDGELLMPPPPKPRDSDGDVGDRSHYYLGRVATARPGDVEHSIYVPSKPSERMSGPRSQAVLTRSVGSSQTQPTHSSQPSSQGAPPYRPPGGVGTGMSQQTPPPPRYQPPPQYSPHLRWGEQPPPATVGQNGELRNACNKLYTHDAPTRNSYPNYSQVELSRSLVSGGAYSPGVARHSIGGGQHRSSPMGQSQHSSSQSSQSPSSPPVPPRAPRNHGNMAAHYTGGAELRGPTPQEPRGPTPQERHRIPTPQEQRIPTPQGLNHHDNRPPLPGPSGESNTHRTADGRPHGSVGIYHQHSASGPVHERLGSHGNDANLTRSGEGDNIGHHGNIGYRLGESSYGLGPAPMSRTNRHAPGRENFELQQLGSRNSAAKGDPGSGNHGNLVYRTAQQNSNHGPGGGWRDSIVSDDVQLSAPSSRSVTPPLPPLSPSNTPPVTPPESPRTRHKHYPGPGEGLPTGYLNRTPDVVTSTNRKHSSIQGGKKKPKKSVPGTSRSKKSPGSKSPYHASPHKGHPYSKSLGALDDVQETALDEDSGDLETSNPGSNTEDYEDVESIDRRELVMVRRQLEGLELMYSEILKLLGVDNDLGPGSRRSISSTSTVSRTGRGSRLHRHHSHRHRARDVKQMNKRFARLESHVVTLARSVAHLSSEMRSQNALFQEVEEMKLDIQRMKEERSAAAKAGKSPGNPGNNEWERFRGWVPMLTNPKRVKKLTKFFGQEPFLHLFMQKLGYEKYIPNFESEKIGMMELPYMNEERLQRIGIPLGPRLRILQESQLCFRQENFDIYIV